MKCECVTIHHGGYRQSACRHQATWKVSGMLVGPETIHVCRWHIGNYRKLQKYKHSHPITIEAIAESQQ